VLELRGVHGGVVLAIHGDAESILGDEECRREPTRAVTDNEYICHVRLLASTASYVTAARDFVNRGPQLASLVGAELPLVPEPVVRTARCRKVPAHSGELARRAEDRVEVERRVDDRGLGRERVDVDGGDGASLSDGVGDIG